MVQYRIIKVTKKTQFGYYTYYEIEERFLWIFWIWVSYAFSESHARIKIEELKNYRPSKVIHKEVIKP